MLFLEGFAPDDARILQESVDRWAAAEASVEQIHASQRESTEAAREKWRDMGGRGWLAIGLPEELGGLGAGGVKDLGIIFNGLGRSVRDEPILSSAVICARLLTLLGTEEQKTDVALIAAGESTFSLAHNEPELGFASEPLHTSFANGALTGRKSFVLDGADADSFLVTALDEGGDVGLFIVPSKAHGLAIVPYQMIDGRYSADLKFSNTPAHRLGSGDVREVLESVLDLAAVLLAADAVGAMAGVIDLTKEYLKSRQQFGRPLDAFQVLRHRLVDMYVHMEETKAMIDMATAALTLESRQEKSFAISALKVQMCRAARFVGQQGVQLHGGMGMTDEYIVSHYFKRLMVAEAFLGNADFHLRRAEKALLWN